MSENLGDSEVIDISAPVYTKQLVCTGFTDVKEPKQTLTCGCVATNATAVITKASTKWWLDPSIFINCARAALGSPGRFPHISLTLLATAKA